MMDRSLQDRLLKRIVPGVVEDYTPAPAEIAPGVFEIQRQFRHFGLARMPSRSTLLGLDDGALVMVSPPPLLDPPTRAALDAIGTVRDIVLPNPFHYLHAAACRALYPAARLLAAPGFGVRVPELTGVEEIGASPPPGWAGRIEVTVLGPVRDIAEVLLFHVASGTLVMTDLAFNLRRHPGLLDRLVWRSSGIPAGFGPGRTSRTLLMRDAAAVSRCLEAALDWPLRRIVVAHGDVVSDDPKRALREAFAPWL